MVKPFRCASSKNDSRPAKPTHGTSRPSAEGGVRYNTRDANTLFTFDNSKSRLDAQDLGHANHFPFITGGIFETGFPDLNLQMWAAYTTERAGQLNDRFGCATIDEAVASHKLFAAALVSNEKKAAVEL